MFRFIFPYLSHLLIVLLVWSSLFLPIATADTSIQPYLDRVNKQITEFTLENGLKFIVLENHRAPVISFFTYADVGGVDEPTGKTGVAHFLEHLAFKGTKTIGTTNYEAEAPLLSSLDNIFTELKEAKKTNNIEKVRQLQQKFVEVETKAQEYVKQNEFGKIVETSGGVGLNAQTSADATVYFYNFPANKLELWMSLESERFLEPVFREFYKEQQVILEERRMRTDNSPIGKMIEAFLDTAFTKHPYKTPVIGYDEDIRNLTREDVETFFATYYPASNITIAIVGDVDPPQVKQLARTYFGRYTKKPQPPEISIVEPPQTATKEVTLSLPSQPWYLEGYHVPGITHPDYVVYQIITSLMSDGRTSRLYQSLVEEQKIALNAEGTVGFPGDKYPNLLLFYALSAPDRTLPEVATALDKEITTLKTEKVSELELARVKTQARAALLRGLDSNRGMARALAEYHTKTGDWRNLFKQLDAITLVTPEDIQRVAQTTFVPENRTIGRIVNSEPNT